MKELTPDIIRDKDSIYSKFLVAVILIGSFVYLAFAFGNPGMESLEREMNRTGENPAIFITGTAYVLGSFANAFIALVFGAIPAVCAAVSFVLEKLAVFFGIRKNGSVNRAAYFIFKGLSIFIIAADFTLTALAFFGIIT